MWGMLQFESHFINYCHTSKHQYLNLDYFWLSRLMFVSKYQQLPSNSDFAKRFGLWLRMFFISFVKLDKKVSYNFFVMGICNTCRVDQPE